jgi:hypothetical protein
LADTDWGDPISLSLRSQLASAHVKGIIMPVQQKKRPSKVSKRPPQPRPSYKEDTESQKRGSGPAFTEQPAMPDQDIERLK